jgi:hypothetical protein
MRLFCCRDRPTPWPPQGAVRRRSAQGLISGFGNPVTATPLWSQRARLAWPEFEVPVATRFEQDYRVCSRTLTRSRSRKPPANPAALARTYSVLATRGATPRRVPYGLFALSAPPANAFGWKTPAQCPDTVIGRRLRGTAGLHGRCFDSNLASQPRANIDSDFATGPFSVFKLISRS